MFRYPTCRRVSSSDIRNTSQTRETQKSDQGNQTETCLRKLTEDPRSVTRFLFVCYSYERRIGVPRTPQDPHCLSSPSHRVFRHRVLPRASGPLRLNGTVNRVSTLSDVSGCLPTVHCIYCGGPSNPPSSLHVRTGSRVVCGFVPLNFLGLSAP